jgi:hypothetical protein
MGTLMTDVAADVRFQLVAKTTSGGGMGRVDSCAIRLWKMPEAIKLTPRALDVLQRVCFCHARRWKQISNRGAGFVGIGCAHGLLPIDYVVPKYPTAITAFGQSFSCSRIVENNACGNGVFSISGNVVARPKLRFGETHADLLFLAHELVARRLCRCYETRARKEPGR